LIAERVKIRQRDLRGQMPGGGAQTQADDENFQGVRVNGSLLMATILFQQSLAQNGRTTAS
jgi:hypothetical protein